MKPYEELIAEAASADVTGWGFAWLDGRATEERPPWGYARLLGDRLATVQSALDIDTGAARSSTRRRRCRRGWPSPRPGRPTPVSRGSG